MLLSICVGANAGRVVYVSFPNANAAVDATYTGLAAACEFTNPTSTPQHLTVIATKAVAGSSYDNSTVTETTLDNKLMEAGATQTVNWGLGCCGVGTTAYVPRTLKIVVTESSGFMLGNCRSGFYDHYPGIADFIVGPAPVNGGKPF